MKINLFFFLLNIFVEVQGLVELPVVEDNSIAITVIAIQNIVNNLLTSLKIQYVKHSLELKQYFTIHNLFVLITLRDCDSWKKIASLSRVNNIDNKTTYFITQINEVLNEGVNNNSVDTTTFIGKLEYLKEWYTTKRNDFVNSDNFNKNLLKYDAKYNNSKTNDESNDIILNDEFWQPSGRRIYKGSRTNIKDFPFMASVQFFGKFQCGGSIIKSDLVITAASCLQLAWNNRFFRENPAYLSVQIGSHFYEHGGETVQAQEIYFHPKYEPRTLRHNLAVMRLSRKISFKTKTRRVKKIDFDRQPDPLFPRDRITIVGWGARDRSNVIYDLVQNKLSYAKLDFYPLDECQEYFSKQYVTKKNFCAGFYSKGSGACNRDVGGPGVIGGKLMGVISFASPVCGAPGPTVFTKVGYYADWIEDIMKQDVPSIAVATTKLLPKIYYKYINTKPDPSISFTPFGDTTAPWMEPLRMDKNLGLRTAADKNYDKGKMLPTLSNEKNRYYKHLDITSKSPPKMAISGYKVGGIRTTHDTKLINLLPSTIGRGSNKNIQVTSKIKKEKPKNNALLSNEKNKYYKHFDITSKSPPKMAIGGYKVGGIRTTRDKRFIDLLPSTIGRESNKNIQVTSKIKKEKPKNIFGPHLGVEMSTESLLNKVMKKKAIEEDLVKLINNLDIDRIVKSIGPVLVQD